MKFVIGSRGSKLALTQPHWVRDRLQTLEPDLDIEVAEIHTTGDTAKGSLRRIGGAGVFTKALARALHDGGCYEIVISDTIGTGTPGSMARVLELVFALVRGCMYVCMDE